MTNKNTLFTYFIMEKQRFLQSSKSKQEKGSTIHYYIVLPYLIMFELIRTSAKL